VAQEDNDPTYVFPAKSGGKVHDNVPYRSLKKTLDTLNIPGDIHKFRHSFASHLAMKGYPLDAIGKFLGHANPSKMTNIYTHLSAEYVVNMLDELG
ncbi:MAG: tyrosine-type recombinase/integrase, partial [Candidatus Marinimicrobia bacterium]|nr:tyrosine-type recombinase/integrase [Candidatus Neomarinimicrobiota bacterium]